MERFTGLIGVALILGIAFLMSNNRKAINYRTVLSGMGLQLALALFILKTGAGQESFNWGGQKIQRLLEMANQGGEVVFGGLMRPDLLHLYLATSTAFFLCLELCLPSYLYRYW